MFLRLPSYILNLDHLHSLTPDPADPTRVALAIDHVEPRPRHPAVHGRGPGMLVGFEGQTKEILILSGADAAAVLRFFGEDGEAPDGLVVDLTTAEPTPTPTSP